MGRGSGWAVLAANEAWRGLLAGTREPSQAEHWTPPPTHPQVQGGDGGADASGARGDGGGGGGGTHGRRPALQWRPVAAGACRSHHLQVRETGSCVSVIVSECVCVCGCV